MHGRCYALCQLWWGVEWRRRAMCTVHETVPQAVVSISDTFSPLLGMGSGTAKGVRRNTQRDLIEGREYEIAAHRLLYGVQWAQPTASSMRVSTTR